MHLQKLSNFWGAYQKRVTSRYFEIKIEEAEVRLEVPVAVYHSTEVGEYIEIKLYDGALGYSYYIYER